MKGVNFVGLRDAGHPVELAVRYSAEGADELVFLDISATIEGRSTFVDTVGEIAAAINIPFTVGGGISDTTHIDALLDAGADKVSINTAAVKDPGLIERAAAEFGSQCIVLAIDAGRVDDDWKVFLNGGRTGTDIDAVEWAKRGVELGAGEILLTSMAADGTKAGFDLELTRRISTTVDVPVIASGGAGTIDHFAEAFVIGRADATLAASVFHFKEISIGVLKSYLRMRGLEVRL